MKKYLLLAVLVMLAGCAAPITKAPWRSYPGALRYNQCERYALAAYEDLTLRGVDAYYVIYGWSEGDDYGRHACVFFQDETGWFFLDNVSAWPIRATGDTVMKMVKKIDRNAYVMWETSGMPIPADWF